MSPTEASSFGESVPRPGLRTGVRKGTRRPLLMLLIASGAAWVACSGKPFDVKPRPSIRPAVIKASGEAAGITLRAEAVTDEDYLYETFDANLIIAGICPVRVSVKNDSSDVIELKRARFEIRSRDGRRFKALKARSAYKRLISYYGISSWSKDGYKRSVADFGSYALDVESPLAPGESRQGLLFFEAPAEVARESGKIFSAARLGNKQTKTDSSLEFEFN